MKIVVCIKQVPSTNEVNLDPITKTIIRDGKQSVINPFDTYALEQAVCLKEKYGGRVSVLSMGIPAVERLLRDAVSRGADDGVLITGREFAGADTLATSYALSLGVRQIGEFDLILCGKMAIDGDTAQIGPELAEHLRIPHVTDVSKVLEIRDGYVICEKSFNGGYQILRVKLPALLTVMKDINMPRMPSISGVRQGINAEIKILGVEETAADTGKIGLSGSPTQVVKTYTPERNAEAVVIAGDTASQTADIMKIISEAVK